MRVCLRARVRKIAVRVALIRLPWRKIIMCYRVSITIMMQHASLYACYTQMDYPLHTLT